MKPPQLAKVAEHWGQTRHPQEKTFFNFPPLRPYLLSCLSGREEASAGPDWSESWTVENYLRDKIPVQKCLSLCCGFGHLERRLAGMGVFKHCLGLDLSSQAVAEAARLAKEAGLENLAYRTADLNEEDFGEEEYDLIWANGAMHHLADPRQVVARIQRALQPGGVFVCNEYIGPNYRQLPYRQRELINAAIHLIPARLRSMSEGTFIPPQLRDSAWQSGLYKFLRLLHRQPAFAPVADFMPPASWPWLKRKLYNFFRWLDAGSHRRFHFGKVWDEASERTRRIDPSECVNSAEILPAISFAFSQVEIRYYNGSILFYILENKFFENFNLESAADREVLAMLINLEKSLLASGELTPDYAHIIANKDPNG
ncbi:MAG: class I SAM-dependent methyltransferase [Planctomycetes bacterium]|nr:class I SAM-dependent methyltransferase [Planctomycetota bacterium]